MAQYTVTSGCGHQTTVQLYGPERGRRARLAWMHSPTGKCNACYAAMKRSEEATQREERLAVVVNQAMAEYRRLDREGRIVAVATLREQLAQGLGSPERQAQARAILAAIEEEA